MIDGAALASALTDAGLTVTWYSPGDAAGRVPTLARVAAGAHGWHGSQLAILRALDACAARDFDLGLIFAFRGAPGALPDPYWCVTVLPEGDGDAGDRLAE